LIRLFSHFVLAVVGNNYKHSLSLARQIWSYRFDNLSCWSGHILSTIPKKMFCLDHANAFWHWEYEFNWNKAMLFNMHHFKFYVTFFLYLNGQTNYNSAIMSYENAYSGVHSLCVNFLHFLSPVFNVIKSIWPHQYAKGSNL